MWENERAFIRLGAFHFEEKGSLHKIVYKFRIGTASLPFHSRARARVIPYWCDEQDSKLIRPAWSAEAKSGLWISFGVGKTFSDAVEFKCWSKMARNIPRNHIIVASSTYSSTNRSHKGWMVAYSGVPSPGAPSPLVPFMWITQVGLNCEIERHSAWYSMRLSFHTAACHFNFCIVHRWVFRSHTYFTHSDDTHRALSCNLPDLPIFHKFRQHLVTQIIHSNGIPRLTKFPLQSLI